MIPAERLIALFGRMHGEGWTYAAGRAEEGRVDCSGAFVWAYRQLGARIPHGSNAIARGHTEGLGPVSEACPGWAAFRVRKPGEAGYALPARYAGSGDRNDYYHIGLVDGTGRRVLSAQGQAAGFTRTRLSGWDAAGRLKAVDYGTERGAEAMRTMTVTSPDGNPVRVRRKPSRLAETEARLPAGTEVLAGEEKDGWRPVACGGTEGFMMSRFLTEGRAAAPDRALTPEEYAALCDARDGVERALEILRRIAGAG